MRGFVTDEKPSGIFVREFWNLIFKILFYWFSGIAIFIFMDQISALHFLSQLTLFLGNFGVPSQPHFFEQLSSPSIVLFFHHLFLASCLFPPSSPFH